MAKPRQRPVDVGQSFHLPPATWSLVMALQDERHPDIPFDDFTVDIVTAERPITFLRPDPRCPEGKQRRVNAVVQYVVTVTIRATLTKNPQRECSYVFRPQFVSSATTARIKDGTYQEGDCE